jgi:hypothetical protein
MSVDILKKIDNVLGEYAEFKKWFYLNAAYPEVEDCVVEDIEECLNRFDINELTNFVDEYLDDRYPERLGDYRRFFNPAKFCNAVSDEDDYVIYKAVAFCKEGEEGWDFVKVDELTEDDIEINWSGRNGRFESYTNGFYYIVRDKCE